MKRMIIASEDLIDLSEYEYVTNVDGYQVYRKIVTDSSGQSRGVWVAQDQDRQHPPFSITYRQARGYDPITEYESNARRLGREIGDLLFGNTVTAASDTQDYDRSFFYDRGRQRYHVNVMYEDDPYSFQFSISEIHPYDDAEYAWARKSSPADLSVIQDGHTVSHIPLPEWDEDEYESADEYYNELLDIACIALKEANAKVSSRMMYD